MRRMYIEGRKISLLKDEMKKRFEEWWNEGRRLRYQEGNTHIRRCVGMI